MYIVSVDQSRTFNQRKALPTGENDVVIHYIYVFINKRKIEIRSHTQKRWITATEHDYYFKLILCGFYVWMLHQRQASCVSSIHKCKENQYFNALNECYHGICKQLKKMILYSFRIDVLICVWDKTGFRLLINKCLK